MPHTPPVLLGGGRGDEHRDDSVSSGTTFVHDEYVHPEFILVDSDPRHIWIGDTHLVETPERRLEPDKHLLTVTGGKVLYEVVNVRDSDTFDVADVPDFVDDVQDPADEIVLKTKYNLELEAYGSTTQSFPRYQYETEQPLTMGDEPPLIFDVYDE